MSDDGNNMAGIITDKDIFRYVARSDKGNGFVLLYYSTEDGVSANPANKIPLVSPEVTWTEGYKFYYFCKLG
jgi:hypothetical protein